MAFAENINEEKLAETALAILSLTSHGEYGVTQAWKGIHWDLLDILSTEKAGYITQLGNRSLSHLLTKGKIWQTSTLESSFVLSSSYKSFNQTRESVVGRSRGNVLPRAGLFRR